MVDGEAQRLCHARDGRHADDGIWTGCVGTGSSAEVLRDRGAAQALAEGEIHQGTAIHAPIHQFHDPLCVEGWFPRRQGRLYLAFPPGLLLPLPCGCEDFRTEETLRIRQGKDKGISHRYLYEISRQLYESFDYNIKLQP